MWQSYSKQKLSIPTEESEMIKLNVASAKCILFIYDTMCELVTYDHQNDQRPIFFSLPLRTQLFL